MSEFQSEVTVADVLVAIGNVQQENSSMVQAVLMNHQEKLREIKEMLVDIKGMLGGKIKPSEESSPGSSLEKVIAKREPAAEGAIVTSTPIMKSRPRNADPDYVPETGGKLLEILCNDCGLTFVRGSGEFTRHVKETPCKPYQCHCGTLFKKKSSLTVHQATHSNETVTCHCGAVFRCEQYLKNHERRQHSAAGDPQDMTAKRPCNASPPETVLKKIKTEGMNDSVFNPMELLQLQMTGYSEPSESEE